MRYALSLLVLLLASPSASAEVSDLTSPPLNPLEQRLFADAADGRLDDFSPLDAALVASGIDDADALQRYERKAAALAERLRTAETLAESPRERAETVFDFMHRRVLSGGYELKHTDLRRVLDAGQYNCVSATVLYNYLAGRLGLDCRALRMPGHAMSRLLLPDGSLDVETTCPSWFQVKDSPERATAAVSQTIGAAASADRSKARVVTPIQLAAMIYYNRGVDLLAENRFADALAADAKALRLDPANRDRPGQSAGDRQQLVDRVGQRGEIRRSGEAAAAGPGPRPALQGLRAKLRPPPSAVGQPAVPRRPLRRSL